MTYFNISDKYRVIYNYNYQFNNAECVGINNHKICHCYDGYIIVNGYCRKGKTHITFRQDVIIKDWSFFFFFDKSRVSFTI